MADSKATIKKKITATQNKIRDAVGKEGSVKVTKPLREKLGKLFKDAKAAGFTTVEIDKMKFRGMPSREKRAEKAATVGKLGDMEDRRRSDIKFERDMEKRDKPFKDAKKRDRAFAKAVAARGGSGSDPTFSIFEMMERPDVVKTGKLSRTRYSPITEKFSPKYKKSNPLGNNKGGLIDYRKKGMFK